MKDEEQKGEKEEGDKESLVVVVILHPKVIAHRSSKVNVMCLSRQSRAKEANGKKNDQEEKESQSAPENPLYAKIRIM